MFPPCFCNDRVVVKLIIVINILAGKAHLIPSVFTRVMKKQISSAIIFLEHVRRQL